MIRGRWIACLAAVVALSGCAGRTESLDSFASRWHQAVNNRQYETLYDMLDAASQRKLRDDLSRLRGLTAEEQRAVIDQLGGERVESLKDVTPQRYFALLWHRLTEGQRPGMQIEAAGADAAYMILTLDGGRRQRIRLQVEGGKWVWTLPEQNFEPKPIVPATRPGQ